MKTAWVKNTEAALMLKEVEKKVDQTRPSVLMPMSRAVWASMRGEARKPVLVLGRNRRRVASVILCEKLG